MCCCAAATGHAPLVVQLCIQGSGAQHPQLSRAESGEVQKRCLLLARLPRQQQLSKHVPSCGDGLFLPAEGMLLLWWWWGQTLPKVTAQGVLVVGPSDGRAWKEAKSFLLQSRARLIPAPGRVTPCGVLRCHWCLCPSLCCLLQRELKAARRCWGHSRILGASQCWLGFLLEVQPSGWGLQRLMAMGSQDHVMGTQLRLSREGLEGKRG